jgi:hypothetical protein
VGSLKCVDARVICDNTWLNETNYAPEGKMMIRNHEGKFASTKQAMIADLEGFIDDWKHWAVTALRNGNREEALRCKRELDDCRHKMRELLA